MNKELILSWVDYFNKADVSSLSSLYHEDAVNHQMPNQPVVGRDNIAAMFEKEFASADMTCLIKQVLADGDWVVLEWTDPLGFCGCGFFQIKDGKIIKQRGYWDKLSFLKIHNLPIS